MKIELSKEQINNLKTFLARVELKGKEAPAFVSILQAIEEGE